MSAQVLQSKKAMGEMKELVLARLGTLNPSSKIILMGGESLTVEDMMKEVENDTNLGKKIIEVHYSFIKMIASGEI